MNRNVTFTENVDTYQPCKGLREKMNTAMQVTIRVPCSLPILSDNFYGIDIGYTKTNLILESGSLISGIDYVNIELSDY